MFGASMSEVYNIIWCQFDLKQGREGHTKVSFSGEFIDWCSSNGGPHKGVR